MLRFTQARGRDKHIGVLRITKPVDDGKQPEEMTLVAAGASTDCQVRPYFSSDWMAMNALVHFLSPRIPLEWIATLWPIKHKADVLEMTSQPKTPLFHRAPGLIAAKLHQQIA